MHRQDDDSDTSTEECEFNGCIRTVGVTNITLSVDKAQLAVVSCTLAQPEQINDWRRTVIIGYKSCRMIVDSGTCINAVTLKLVSTLGMKLLKHPTLQGYMDRR